MNENNQLVIGSVVAVEKEIDGIEMGVMSDGTGYLTLRGLATVCGLAPSAIITTIGDWNNGKRTSAVARHLLAHGVDSDRLSIPIEGKSEHAVPDFVCVAVLDYYAFQPGRDIAKKNYRILALKGLRDYIYDQTGYSPASTFPESFRNFHDRVMLNRVPSGYYSVFKEMAEYVIRAIQNGFPLDQSTIPDLSVGKVWSNHWQESNFEEQYGSRIKYDHNYPEYYPQAESNPQPSWAYPVESLGAFRTWMDKVYWPEKFPGYAKKKLATPIYEKLMAAMKPEELGPGNDE